MITFEELRRRVGETITVGREDRTITDIMVNDGSPVFVWESGRGRGVCVISLWDGWKNGTSKDY